MIDFVASTSTERSFPTIAMSPCKGRDYGASAHGMWRHNQSRPSPPYPPSSTKQEPTLANTQTDSDLKYLSAGTLLDTQCTPADPIVTPWLMDGQAALIWAAGGVGKSWLTLSLSIAVAGGGRVHEWEAPKARRVLFLDGEMDQRDLAERVRSLIDTEAVSGVDAAALRKNLIFYPRQAQNPDATFFDIADPDSQSAIQKAAEKHGADLLVIDNLSTVADSLSDENDAAAMTPIMQFLLRMKQAGIATILVHHSRKDGSAARGSTKLATTFNVMIGLKRSKLAPPERASFRMEFEKFRGKANASLEPVVWSLSDVGWDVERDEESLEDRVVAAIESLKYTSQTEIARALGVDKSTISRTMQRLNASGRYSKDGAITKFGQAKELRMHPELVIEEYVPDGEDDF